ncbi:MAG: DUF1549 and DUF1553 domain-containing protein [Isosphaeraceae bacterium]|nr:DUF1549 and DUF1553 domain-containing protein [Isosphaeraceae bacterium]
MMRNARFWIVTACLAAGAGVSRAAEEGSAAGIARNPPDTTPAARGARALTETIDRLLAAKWTESNVHPAAPADDAEYLRRVYLDLVGKIPTVSEARDFLEDTSPDKRQRLVESLLDSSAYLTRATEIYRSMLLPEADTDGQARQLAPTFEAWLRKRVSDNAGYDQIVREVLTVRLGGRGRRGGNAFDPKAEPSPLAFYVAKEAKPENLASGAARVFLGIRLECAQCHNHPFARWKREEFWGLAAFFAGVGKPGKNDAVTMSVNETPNKHELAIPGTAKIVQASFLGSEEKPRWGRRADSGRDVLADWMLAPENPYFTRAAVNRVWARFFGVGLVEPIDDMGEDNPPAHPELLDELARQFRSHDYDLRFLIRAITATKAYSLTSAVGRAETASSQMFAAMPVRSLSSGQFFDTVAQATGYRENGPRNLFFEGTAKTQFLELFANRDEKPTEGQTSILQALSLMNGPLTSSVTTLKTGDTLAAVSDAPFLDTAGRIETMYLATLTRRPRPDETDRLVKYVEAAGPEKGQGKALADVFWALLNSPEFRFNH